MTTNRPRPEYPAEDLLPISGLQHFLFCRRQWALIHVERQWQESGLTLEGRLLHQRADDPFADEVRDGVILARAVPVASYHLGLNGVCDMVEFSPSPEGIALPGRQGTYLPLPVEYKLGRPKRDACDEVQLCAQALCLEEMLAVKIERGFLFYGEIRRRTPVLLTTELRALVERMTAEMHDYFTRGYTPRVKISKACRSCSLAELCLPNLQAQSLTASEYLRRKFGEDDG
jgi:CRISPR-associated exonuclease Cas4